MHLAQFNMARAIAPLGDPMMAEFVAQLDQVNAEAEASVGFVWRLKAEDVGVTGYVHAANDPTLLINLTVWKSLESLYTFTYRSNHAGVFRDRRTWFEAPQGPSFALWWATPGEIPTVEEGYVRLAHLEAHGPSLTAFTFKVPFTYAPSPSRV